MRKSDLSLKAIFLNHFFDWSPETVKLMHETSHHYSSDIRSPYHMEGDVWTHTMIAYSHLDLSKFTTNVEKFSAIISVLSHDIGKCYCIEKSVEPPFKVMFYGHANFSIQPCIDFCYYVKDRMKLSDVVFSRMTELSIQAISKHFDIFMTPDTKMPRFMEYDETLRGVLHALCYADTNGQIKSVDTLNKSNFKLDYQFDESTNLEKPELNTNKKTLYLFCGCPGSGKDYQAEKLGAEIHSFDKIRVSEYLKFDKHNVGMPNEVYANAFDYCNEHRIDLNKIMVSDIIKSKSDVLAICNTNLNTKARKRIINTLKGINGYNVIAVYVGSHSENIFKRNIGRQDVDKTIPHTAICNFIKKQSIPSMSEGFDDVRFIFS